mgnify:CR=1 FL=1
MLFGSSRDAKLIKHFNRELIHKIISQEIAFYKLSIEDSRITLYNESSQKFYFNPIRLFCLINKEETSSVDEDTGMNFIQNVTFSFIRDDLKEQDIFIEEGDIIKFDSRFYEVDNTQTTQYWVGRNPETFLKTTEGRSNYGFGYNIAVSCKAHLTKLSTLNLVEIRSGINTNRNLPRNL